MKDNTVLGYIKEVMEHIPSDWLRLTTHRLDIYNESLAKTEFLQEFEALYAANEASESSLAELPTAYDYIRLGHPLSTVLEWAIAKSNALKPDAVIAFDSKTTPILAVLRKNLLEGKKTQIVYTDSLPISFNADAIKLVYGYDFELLKVNSVSDIASFDGSVLLLAHELDLIDSDLFDAVDFYVSLYGNLGSVIVVNKEENASYISEIQHVRRRETIAMTPSNCAIVLNAMLGQDLVTSVDSKREQNRDSVVKTIQEINGVSSNAVVASSGLSMQYAVMMGLIEDAMLAHPGKAIRFIVPPNCYGGTNDQARRVATCLDNVEVLDLPVDGDNDMVQSVERVLDMVAKEDAIPYIIAEIPTNPRVEVPDLNKLSEALNRPRQTEGGHLAIAPVFIIDQTFCPNYQFLTSGSILSGVRTLSYVSGSKFPSGGKCTAGYCTSNTEAASLLVPIDKHLQICDNEATDLQLEILAAQMPSMNERIALAYKNTRDFVNFIHETLPDAKINFVSEELAAAGFTPSVFSLDLPTKGNSAEERELYKRSLNDKLITMMINEIPNESKYCVSYGQLKGCYWTIPATSTQGTTKESDKDYIARVAVSPNLDLNKHKEVFKKFVAEM